MSHSVSRREVLQTGLGIAAGVAIGLVPKRGFAATSPSSAPDTHAFVTDQSGRRHTPFDEVINTASADVTFTFDAVSPQQTILGFGAALTEAACTVLDRLLPADRDTLLDELYNPARSNLSTGRLCIGASDYSTKLYSYDDGEADPDLKRFSIEHDMLAVLPVLRQARRVRPDMFLFASPWSPPGWMKYGGSMLGGGIKPHNLDVYARYIIRYLQAYQQAGITVDAMTVQNEIDADQDGRMPACAWPEEVESDYIEKHLGPLIAESELKTQLWILDHNYDLAGRVLDQLNKPKLRSFVSAVAWHGYAGEPRQIIPIRRLYPSIDAHWTEGGDLVHSSTLLTAWAKWASTFAVALNCGVSSITTWNLALDESGGPNIGPFRCTGLITIDSKTKKIVRNGIYWSLVHYAKAMPRGSRVLPLSTSVGGAIAAVAAQRPDGAYAVVVPNSGPAVNVRLAIGNRTTTFKAGQNSVTTILL